MLRAVCRRPMALALVSLAGLATSGFAQVGPFTGSEVLDLSAISFPAGTRTDFPFAVTDSGQVVGYSRVDRTDNGESVFVSWTVTPGSPAVELALSGPQYVQPDGLRYSFANAINANGQIIGATTRVNSFAVGADAFVFDGQQFTQLGLNATDVGQTPETAYEVGNFPQIIAANGDVVGGTFVLRNDGAHFNTGWVARNGVTTLLGLEGPEFIDPSRNAPFSFASDINGDGVVVGSSVKFGSRITNKAFKLENGQYAVLGLTGPAYEDLANGIEASSVPSGISENGVIAGSTTQIAGLGGTGAWVDTGSGAFEVGLRESGFVSPDNNAQSSIMGISDGGVAYGYSNKFPLTPNTAGGLDYGAFVVLGTETVRIGLTDALHVSIGGNEFNFPIRQTKDGAILGFATRVDLPDNLLQRASAWIFDPARRQLGTVRLGLVGPQYIGADGSEASYVTDANDGVVAGLSAIFIDDEPFWFDGFVTNLDAGTTTTLRFSQDSQGRARTYPLIVTPRGGVFGYYTKFENDQNVGDRPFYWSPRAGFVDLLPAGTPAFDFGTLPEIAVSPDGVRVAIAGTLLTGDPTLLRVTLPERRCDSIDFNNDASVFDPVDIDAFLSVFSEGPCIPAGATCNDVDFNNDGSVFDPQDIDSFLSVFSEGPCI
jgi:uncharacterized membrane protein